VTPKSWSDVLPFVSDPKFRGQHAGGEWACGSDIASAGSVPASRIDQASVDAFLSANSNIDSLGWIGETPDAAIVFRRAFQSSAAAEIENRGQKILGSCEPLLDSHKGKPWVHPKASWTPARHWLSVHRKLRRLGELNVFPADELLLAGILSERLLLEALDVDIELDPFTLFVESQGRKEWVSISFPSRSMLWMCDLEGDDSVAIADGVWDASEDHSSEIGRFIRGAWRRSPEEFPELPQQSPLTQAPDRASGNRLEAEEQAGGAPTVEFIPTVCIARDLAAALSLYPANPEPGPAKRFRVEISPALAGLIAIAVADDIVTPVWDDDLKRPTDLDQPLRNIVNGAVRLLRDRPESISKRTSSGAAELRPARARDRIVVRIKTKFSEALVRAAEDVLLGRKSYANALTETIGVRGHPAKYYVGPNREKAVIKFRRPHQRGPRGQAKARKYVLRSR